MHKVRKSALFNISTPFGIVGFVTSVCVLLVLGLVSLSSDPFYPLLYGLLASAIVHTGYSAIKFMAVDGDVNRIEQPKPSDVIDNFYQWEKGDEVLFPWFDYRGGGYYVGVKDDGSIVLDTNSGRFNSRCTPKETVHGEELDVTPRYYEIPPKFFEYADYENLDLLGRKKEKMNNRIEKEVSESFRDQVIEEAKKEISEKIEENKEEEDGLKKPSEPKDRIIRW